MQWVSIHASNLNRYQNFICFMKRPNYALIAPTGTTVDHGSLNENPARTMIWTLSTREAVVQRILSFSVILQSNVGIVRAASFQRLPALKDEKLSDKAKLMASIWFLLH